MVAGRNQNELADNHVERLRDAYRNFSDEEGFSRVVDLSEIAANDYNLHLPFYVMPPEEEDEAEREDVEQALAQLEDQMRQRNREIRALFQEMGL
jgi:type I restriction enzyme M protein